MSTSEAVGRSHVRSVWSHDVECATVESLEANVMADTGAECDFKSTTGPRRGVVFRDVSFRRLAREAELEVIRDSGAEGAFVGSVDQTPTV